MKEIEIMTETLNVLKNALMLRSYVSFHVTPEGRSMKSQSDVTFYGSHCLEM